MRRAYLKSLGTEHPIKGSSRLLNHQCCRKIDDAKGLSVWKPQGTYHVSWRKSRAEDTFFCYSKFYTLSRAKRRIKMRASMWKRKSCNKRWTIVNVGTKLKLKEKKKKEKKEERKKGKIKKKEIWRNKKIKWKKTHRRNSPCLTDPFRGMSSSMHADAMLIGLGLPILIVLHELSLAFKHNATSQIDGWAENFGKKKHA